ncbi:MAG: hypothetical protein V3R52_04555 [Candidatus Neomarinimicrobiota bacterium]
MTRQNDLKIIDDLTAELYKAICFEVDNHPKVEKLKDLFIPTANMIRNEEASPEIMTVEAFIKSYSDRISDGTIRSFYEGELNHITEIFGTIAHRFSTYETKFDLNNPAPFSTGINSIQFIKIGADWKISGIVWNNQTSENKIPDRYLPNG